MMGAQRRTKQGKKGRKNSVRDKTHELKAESDFALFKKKTAQNNVQIEQHRTKLTTKAARYDGTVSCKRLLPKGRKEGSCLKGRSLGTKSLHDQLVRFAPKRFVGIGGGKGGTGLTKEKKPTARRLTH